MDPKATLQLLQDAFLVSDFDAWRDSAADLMAWRRAGGYMPDVWHVVTGERLLLVAAERRVGLLRVARVKGGQGWDVNIQRVTWDKPSVALRGTGTGTGTVQS